MSSQLKFSVIRKHKFFVHNRSEHLHYRLMVSGYLLFAETHHSVDYARAEHQSAREDAGQSRAHNDWNECNAKSKQSSANGADVDRTVTNYPQ